MGTNTQSDYLGPRWLYILWAAVATIVMVRGIMEVVNA